MAFVPVFSLQSQRVCDGSISKSPLRGWKLSKNYRPLRATRVLTMSQDSEGSSGIPNQNDNDDSSLEQASEGKPGSSKFPKLYDAWFEPESELAVRACESIVSAYNKGVRAMELQWPTVPNLEEISAGTLLNFEFGKQAARALGMGAPSEYQLVKRYLASFSNVYWAQRIASARVFDESTIWVVSTDSISKSPTAETLASRRIRLSTMRNIQKEPIGDSDVIIIMDPRFTDTWKKGLKARPPKGTVIFLNSQFNESYSLTGPRNGVLKEIETVFFLKRVTRGYVFCEYPGPWTACLETPGLDIEILQSFDSTPTLREVSNIVRQESNKRYGAFYNDRYVRGFGGRL